MKNFEFHRSLYKEPRVISMVHSEIGNYDKNMFPEKRIIELGNISSKEKDQWNYIPCGSSTVVDASIAIFEIARLKLLQNKGLNILDLGCGTGRILNLFKATFSSLINLEFGKNTYWYKYNLTGIEINRKLTLQLTKEDKCGARIINKDMFKAHNEIHKADIVFSYIPVKDSHLQYKMLDLLSLQVKPGTFLVLPGYSSKQIENLFKYNILRLNRETYLAI